MKLFQVCGVCQKRKHWFGLKWKTYESFKDSQILGDRAAKYRVKELKTLSILLAEKVVQSRELLEKNDLSPEIIKITELKIYPVRNGDYIGDGKRIYVKEDLAPTP